MKVDEDRYFIAEIHDPRYADHERLKKLADAGALVFFDDDGFLRVYRERESAVFPEIGGCEQWNTVFTANKRLYFGS